MESIILTIIFFVLGMFVLSYVIEASVKKGINGSVVGQFLEKKYGIKEEKKDNFLEKDFDDKD